MATRATRIITGDNHETFNSCLLAASYKQQGDAGDLVYILDPGGDWVHGESLDPTHTRPILV